MQSIGSTNSSNSNYKSSQNGNGPNSAAQALSARVTALSNDDFVRTPLSDESQQKANNLDPQVLARIALEEELKKKGGGGGGARSFNPLVWIPYSFKLLAQAIEEARQAFFNAVTQAAASISDLISNTTNSSLGLIGRLTRPITSPIASFINFTITSLAKTISSFTRNPLGFTLKFINNAILIASSIASAIASGLKKLFSRKEEGQNEIDNYLYEDEGLLTKLLKFFTRSENKNKNSNAFRKARLRSKKRIS